LSGQVSHLPTLETSSFVVGQAQDLSPTVITLEGIDRFKAKEEATDISDAEIRRLSS